MAIGYIALWRKIEDHEFYKEKREYSKLEAWIDILLETQHCEEPKDVVIKMKVFKCYYGESLKSLRTWGSRWGWSEAKVKRFFNLLTNTFFIIPGINPAHGKIANTDTKV